MTLGGDDFLYFTTFAATVCNIGKLSTKDGSVVAFNQLDAAIVDCTNLVVSNDQNYVYVAANNNTSPHRIIELSASTLAFSRAFGQDSDILLEMKPLTISGDNRVLFTIAHTIASTATVFATVNVTSSSALNSQNVVCSSCSATPSAKAYVDSTNNAYIMMMDVNVEKFFKVDLLTMTITSGTTFDEIVAQVGTVVTSVGSFGDVSQIYTTSYNSLGSKIRIYDTLTNTFVQIYSTTGRSIFATGSFRGFLYASNQQAANSAILHKINYKDDIIRNALIQTAVLDMAASSTPFGTSSTAFSDQISGRTSTAAVLTPDTLPAINVMLETTYPLNYNNGSFVTIYASQGVTSDIDMNVPCLSDGSSGLVAVMANYFNGSVSPVWVTPDPDLSGILTVAPAIGTLDQVSFHIGMNFGYAGNTFTQYNELVVHQ